MSTTQTLVVQSEYPSRSSSMLSTSSGTKPARQFRSLEVIKAKALAAEGSTDEHTLQAIDDALNVLKARLSATQSKDTEQDDRLDKLEAFNKSLRVVVEDMNETLNQHTRAFQEIHELMLDTIDLAMGYRPSAVAIMLRRQLDDVRTCVGNAFIVLFPSYFNSDRLINRNNASRLTVDLWVLRTALNVFLKNHLRLEKSADKKVTVAKAYQLSSVFSHCDVTKLLTVRGTDKRPGQSRFVSPKSKPFKERALPMWDKKTNRFQNHSSEQQMVFIMRFFLPAFIWAFNELKDAVHQSEKRVRKHQTRVVRNEQLIIKNGGQPKRTTSVMNVKEPSFQEGTARKLRAEEYPDVTPLAVDGEPLTAAQLFALLQPAAQERELFSMNRKRAWSRSSSDLDEEERAKKRHEFGETSEASATQVDESMEQATGNGDDPDEEANDATLQIKNAEAALVEQYKELDDEVLYLEGLKVKFDAVRTYIAVVLNEKIMQLALQGNSLLRQCTDYLGHKSNVINETFKDALSQTNALVEAYQNDPDVKAEKARRKGKEPVALPDPKAEMARLSDLIYKPSEYFKEGNNEVEAAVDHYLASSHTENTTDTMGASDFRLLLSWLEKASPVPTEEK